MNRSLALKLIVTTTLFITIAGYFAWQRFSAPDGDQKVGYVPSKKECFSGNGYRYCLHVPQTGNVNGSVAYLLHGRNLDENTWNDDTFYTAMIQQYWQTHNITPPTVVTVSFGPIWLLTPKTKAAHSGLLDTFVNDVIPEVEKRTGIPTQRIVFGESMGGLNTLMLALQRGDLFSKAAALCPAVYKGSPFDSLAETRQFIKRTGADPKVIFGIRQLAKDYFAGGEEWFRSSPTQRIEINDPIHTPEIYLSCGLYDTYGNFEGNELLARRAQARGFAIEWHPIYGGHCAIDTNSLAEFLARSTGKYL